MNEELLKAAHKKYLEVRSLNKTCKWLAEEHGVEVTRHQLSPMFHRAGLHVQPPNGKPVRHYQPAEFLNGWNRLAGDWIELLWRDILGYLNGESLKIYYMAGCFAFSGPLYEDFINRLNVNRVMVTPDQLPPGVSTSDIVRGRELYVLGYNYWVAPLGGS